MPNFALERINTIKGKEPFYQLKIDGEKVLDGFEKEINNNNQYCSEYKTMYKYMEFVADGRMLPPNKYKEIHAKSGKDQIKEFEFKSKHLRIYGIKLPNGKIIISGGYKNSQKKDISAFQSLKKQYINSLK